MGGFIIEEEASGTAWVAGTEVPWVDKVRFASDTRRWREFTFAADGLNFYDETTISVDENGSIHIALHGSDAIGETNLSSDVLEFLIAQRKLMSK